MNPQQTLRLALTKLPTEIQREAEQLWLVGARTEQFIEELERNGKIFRKSVEISIEARKEGNALYTKKGHDSHMHKAILVNYSRSIAFAPKGTEELVLGYSNRSVLLMHLRRYKESLVDIDTALQLSKSDELKRKLLTRKEKCLRLINEDVLKESAKNLSLCNNENLESFASKLTNFKSSATLPCASDCVGLAYNDTFGRHLVATRDIEPGEVLIVEEGYVCHPTPHEMYLVCSHCLQMAWNGIPCDNCIYVIYCSEACKNEALEEYHDIECPIVKYMDCSIFTSVKDVCDRMITIRLLIKAVKKEGYESIMKEVFKEGNEVNLDVLLSDGILRSDKFKSFYNLLAKELGKEYENDELHILQIVYLLIEYTDFLDIGKSSVCNITTEPHLLLKFKEVLRKLRYITITNGYAFQTTSWQCGCNDFYECSKKCNSYRGFVIVPCCSLVNHSCTPNVSHSCAPKRKIIVFSTSPIKKGEQLCDSYGVTLLDDLKVRQNKLKEFHFTCKCKACLDKIDNSMVQDNCLEDRAKILTEFKKYLPMVLKMPLENPQEDWEMSEEVLQDVIKMSQLFYEHFNYYKASVHSYTCKSYIEKMMSKLYEEKSAIPNDC